MLIDVNELYAEYFKNETGHKHNFAFVKFKP